MPALYYGRDGPASRTAEGGTAFTPGGVNHSGVDAGARTRAFGGRGLRALCVSHFWWISGVLQVGGRALARPRALCARGAAVVDVARGTECAIRGDNPVGGRDSLEKTGIWADLRSSSERKRRVASCCPLESGRGPALRRGACNGSRSEERRV